MLDKNQVDKLFNSMVENTARASELCREATEMLELTSIFTLSQKADTIIQKWNESNLILNIAIKDSRFLQNQIKSNYALSLIIGDLLPYLKQIENECKSIIDSNIQHVNNISELCIY